MLVTDACWTALDMGPVAGGELAVVVTDGQVVGNLAGELFLAVAVCTSGW